MIFECDMVVGGLSILETGDLLGFLSPATVSRVYRGWAEKENMAEIKHEMK